MAEITVIGTGYVGLVSGACLSDFGNNVRCVDVDHEKIEKLKAGGIPIYEPGLEDVVARNVAANRLSFATDGASAIGGSETVFIAVGTPPADDGSADVYSAEADIRGIGRFRVSQRSLNSQRRVFSCGPVTSWFHSLVMVLIIKYA